MTDARFFKAEGPFTLDDLALISNTLIANRAAEKDVVFSGVATFDKAETTDVTACYDKSLKDKLGEVKAGVCVTTEELAPLFPKNVNVLAAKDARKAFALIIRAFYPIKKPNPFISDKAYISKSAKIGKDVRIEAGAFIGDNAEIGDSSYIAPNAVIGEGVILGEGCSIGANASLAYAVLGKNVRIYSGARIGEDGFGFVSSAEGHLKIPQIGRVIIEDNVEIGANTCIDRGALDDTCIKSGTIMDNLVQVGHNNTIGHNCVLVSQVGVAGSCTFGDFVVAGGQAGFRDHLHIGTAVQVGAQSGVMNDLQMGEVVLGSPAAPAREYLKQVATIRKLTKK